MSHVEFAFTLSNAAGPCDLSGRSSRYKPTLEMKRVPLSPLCALYDKRRPRGGLDSQPRARGPLFQAFWSYVRMICTMQAGLQGAFSALLGPSSHASCGFWVTPSPQRGPNWQLIRQLPYGALSNGAFAEP